MTDTHEEGYTPRVLVTLEADTINAALAVPQTIIENLSGDNVDEAVKAVHSKLLELRNKSEDDMLRRAETNDRRMANFLEFCRTGKYPDIVGHMSATLRMQATPAE